MAKSNTIQVKMVSTANTGYFYVKFRNPKTKTEKLELKKYDPKARKHVIFKEQKIKYKNGTVINPPPIPNNPATNPTGIAVKAINRTI